MKPMIVLTALLGLLAVTAGCGAKASKSSTAETAPGGTTQAAASRPQGAGHGDTTAVPGSYEDWCEEHQVPESQDTRCDPSLVAAFQASNDWCAEHGLPMSQCTIHNPNLKIVRPPKPEGR